MIPWALPVGAAVLAWLLFGDRLLPAHAVETETVVTVRNTAAQSPGGAADPSEGDPWEASLLFQASGWIEPDPLPIKATALVDGVVDTVSVLEGETVKKGQRLASLIREDFELDLETAESDLASLRAHAAAHEEAIAANEAELHTLHMQVKAGNLKCLELEDRRNRLRNAGKGAVAEAELAKASLMLQTHSGEVSALEASEAEVRVEKRRLEAMRGDFDSRIRRAETEVARKKLALSRAEIASPVDGIVLRLLAVPGQKRMLGMDDHDSATIAILYQPDHLQARVDVPLEEAAKMSVGQAVRLRSSFLPDRVFRGVVTRIGGEADLQRNTLQAKVRVLDPDARLRPDMLCRAEFLAAIADGEAPRADGEAPKAEGRGKADSGGGPARSVSGRVALFVPDSVLRNASGDAATVWIIDPGGERIEEREVRLGARRREDYREVVEGLRPGDRIVTSAPADALPGDRVKWKREEDA